MAELKTKKTKASVKEFVRALPDAGTRADVEALLQLFTQTTKEKAVLWSNGIIGFGEYYYESERSAQKGHWMLTGFSVRKQNITIYIMPGFKEYGDIIKKLGKFTVSGGSCLYIKKLEDINTKLLAKLVKLSVADMRKRYQKKPQRDVT